MAPRRLRLLLLLRSQYSGVGHFGQSRIDAVVSVDEGLEQTEVFVIVVSHVQGISRLLAVLVVFGAGGASLVTGFQVVSRLDDSPRLCCDFVLMAFLFGRPRSGGRTHADLFVGGHLRPFVAIEFLGVFEQGRNLLLLLTGHD